MRSNFKSYLKKDIAFMGQCGEKTNLTDSYGWKMCVGDYAEIRKENDSEKVTRFVVNPKEEAYIDGFKDALVISANDSGDGVIQYYLWNGEKYIVQCKPLHKDAYLFGEKNGISAVLNNIYSIRKGSVTTCCGFDFGQNIQNTKFCPVCGKHLLIKYSKPAQKKG